MQEYWIEFFSCKFKHPFPFYCMLIYRLGNIEEFVILDLFKNKQKNAIKSVLISLCKYMYK